MADGWMARQILLLGYTHHYVAGRGAIGETPHCETTDLSAGVDGDILRIDQVAPGLVRYHVSSGGEVRHYTYSGPYLIDWDCPPPTASKTSEPCR